MNVVSLPDGTEHPVEVQRRCPACASTGSLLFAARDKLHATDGSWPVCRCDRCRSLWISPRPVDPSWAYPTEYFTHASDTGSAPEAWSRKSRLGQAVLAARFGYPWPELSRLDTFVSQVLRRTPVLRARATRGLGELFPRFQDGGRLLDVGCGGGTFLADMRRRGWNVQGQDVDPAAVDAARRNHSLDVSTRPLRELAAAEAPFDVVTAHHVLEHAADPTQFLADVAQCMRSGGRLLLVTPNARSFGFRGFRNDWYPIEFPRHLAIYSPDGLRSLFDRVPDLDIESLATLSRTAQKIYLQWRDVRRHGRFRSGAAPTWLDRRGAAGYSLVEGIVNRFLPVGEELAAVVVRR